MASSSTGTSSANYLYNLYNNVYASTVSATFQWTPLAPYTIYAAGVVSNEVLRVALAHESEGDVLLMNRATLEHLLSECNITLVPLTDVPYVIVNDKQYTVVLLDELPDVMVLLGTYAKKPRTRKTKQPQLAQSPLTQIPSSWWPVENGDTMTVSWDKNGVYSLDHNTASYVRGTISDVRGTISKVWNER